MKYIKIDGGNLFAYEENSATTLVFFNNKWDISSMSYNALLIEKDAKFISEIEAIKISNNIRPDSVFEKIVNFERI